MVPYVRKSFLKHYRDALTYMYHGNERPDLDWTYDCSIDDERYDIFPDAKQYALDMTHKELEQAVEGMYHNLNN